MQCPRTSLTATAILAVLSAFALLGVGSRTAPAHAADTASAASTASAAPDAAAGGPTARAAVPEDDDAPDAAAGVSVGTMPGTAAVPYAAHRSHAVAAENAAVLPRPDVVTAGRAPPA